MNAGALTFAFAGTYVDSYEVEPVPGLGSYDCAGYYGTTCGDPLPAWKHRLRTTWRSPWDFDISLNWRHIAPMDDDASSSNPMLSGTTYASDEHVNAYDYFDLAVSVKASDMLSFRLGVNNIFDRDPPVIGSSTLGGLYDNSNTYPGVYDALGRYVFFAISAGF